MPWRIILRDDRLPICTGVKATLLAVVIPTSYNDILPPPVAPAAVPADTVRPMLELIWAPLLGAFSLLFDEYSDPRLLAICLAGFEAATCLAAQLGVTQLRDVFVNSLCNFTHLHTPRCA